MIRCLVQITLERRTMAQIHVLDQHTINQIAAGEVIERPASVVKELVENAIDAGSNAITVEIKDGGISLIRVTDNGKGILRDEVKIAFLRHATSKIKTATDLLYVNSLGFRGEALSSISAISKVELVTKTDGNLTGVRYQIHGGKEAGYEEIGCPEGTTFLVRDLFYNVPARKKFLKSASTEASHVDTLMQRIALSHPNVSFKFINNGQMKLQTSGNGNLKDIIYHIYGRDAVLSLIPIQAENEICKIDGFVGKPVFSRGNRGFENYFVNGRFIKNQIITQAIEEAYKTFTMVHKYPFTSLNLTIDNSLIDVNVHPAKLEVRFRNGEELFSFIADTIKTALKEQELIPNIPAVMTKSSFEQSSSNGKMLAREKSAEPFEKRRIQEEREKIAHEGNFLKEYVQPINPYSIKNPEVGERIIETAKGLVDRMIPDKMPERSKTEDNLSEQAIIESEKPIEEISSEIRNMEQIKSIETLVESPKNSVQEKTTYPIEPEISIVAEEQASFLSEVAKQKYRLIGQLFRTYWLFEFDHQLYILDQHAAHEKVNYEKLMKDYKNREICSQQLAPPILLTLTMQEQTILEQFSSYFKELGFCIEPFGGNEYKISAVPTTLYGMEDKEAFLTLLDSISEDTELVDPEKITDRIATMACKASVKGNQKLSYQEVEALMEQLMGLENPYTCPHGRPTIISMSQTEIEKRFKRIQ